MDSFADLFLNKIDWYIRKRLMLFWNEKRNRRKKHSNARIDSNTDVTSILRHAFIHNMDEVDWERRALFE